MRPCSFFAVCRALGVAAQSLWPTPSSPISSRRRSAVLTSVMHLWVLWSVRPSVLSSGPVERVSRLEGYILVPDHTRINRGHGLRRFLPGNVPESRRERVSPRAELERISTELRTSEEAAQGWLGGRRADETQPQKAA